jgi:hypothetical protein
MTAGDVLLKVYWTAAIARRQRPGAAVSRQFRATLRSLDCPSALPTGCPDGNRVVLRRRLTMANVEAREAGVLMTTCTQPGCTGTIVDGYCDVCGSPAGAAPFVPAGAAASASSSAAAAEPGLAAVLGEPGLHPKPKSGSLMTACTQPVCTGMIVDGYCDVCGSPPGAVPFVPAAPSPASPAIADEPGGAQDYRTRVEEAQLPDDVRKAALCEVGELERTSDQSPESGDIRTWLDTILDLPWSTETTDWINIQGSREVEATLRRLIEPAAVDLEEGDTAEVEAAAVDLEEGDTAEVEAAAVDLEEGDTAEVEAAAADLEKADTAPAGPQHDDTVNMPAVPAVASGGRHQRPQLPEQPVLESEPVQTPAEKRRFGSLVIAATALAALLIGALLFGVSRDRGVSAQSVPAVTATATATVSMPTSEPPGESTHTGSTIQLEDLPDPARPFETIRIQGRYRDGADTFLQVQRSEGGKWLAFPVPTKTDQSGRFTAYVEFGQPGRYRLRVLDPASGVTSKPFVLVIEA